MTSRTMIYLEGEQLEALKQRARAERISVAELVRRLVRQYLAASAGAPRTPPDVFARIVDLGASGHADVADRHDRYLADALHREHLR